MDRLAALALLVTLGGAMPATSHAGEASPQFGLALNSSFSGEVYPIRLVPTVTMRQGRTQLEAGLGFHPFIRKDQRVLSGELNALFFPNGLDNALDLYVIGRFSYVNNDRDTFFPTTYHYLFVNGGYGVMVNGEKGQYLGTNVTVGAYTYLRRSENPWFDDDALFDEGGLTLALQFNVGYRF